MQIIVLGMHRSGTSVLARILNMMGAYFAPEDKIMYPASDNPKGFWERTDAVQLNDDILQAGEGSWSNVLDFAIDNISIQDRRNLEQQIKRLIAAMDANRPWMLKDPRLCLTLPLWRAYLELPVCVHIQRNPLQVARSLWQRDAIPVTVGVAMWEAYTVAALNNSCNLTNIMIDEAKLMSEPQATVQQLKKALEECGVDCLRLPTNKELTSFIDKKLQHHNDSANCLPAVLNGQQQALWQTLTDGQPFASPTFHELSVGAKEVYRTYLSLCQAIEQFDTLKQDFADTVAKSKQDLAEFSSKLQQTQVSQAANVTTINNLHSRLADCSSAVQKANLELKLHGQEITKLQEILDAKERVLEQYSAGQSRMQETIERLVTLKILIKELKDNIEATFMSWRWKIGHFTVRLLEILLGRGNVVLAKYRIEQILRELSANADLQDLKDQIAKVTALPGNMPANLLWGIPTPSALKDRKAAYTELCQQKLITFLDSGAILEISGLGQPRVSVIVVLYNRCELTLACLKTLQEVTEPSLELIVVDNASTDRTAELLDRLRGRVTIIRNAENRHFLLACNQAASHCKGEYILFLNNDAMLLPGAIANALQVFQEETTVGAVGGKIILLDGTLQEAGSIVWNDGSCYGYGRGGDPTEAEFMFRRSVDYCSGAFLLVPRSIHTELGGFDTAYAPAYYEETDFCLRLRQRNMDVVYEPTVQIIHYEFASTTSSNQAIAQQRNNQSIFVAKHASYLASRKPPDPAKALEARTADNKPWILYIDDRVPHCKYGSGFPRSNFILNTIAQRCNVTLMPLNFPSEGTWTTTYTDISKRVEVLKGCGRTGFSAMLKSRKDYYAAVMVSRPHNMEFYSAVHRQIYGSTGGPQLIYDAEAIFGLRDAMKARVLGGMIMDENQAISNEIALAHRATRVIAVSQRERQIFLTQGVAVVDVVGHAIKSQPTDMPFAKRQGILFVGNMDAEHSPNVDSVLWFLAQVFENIRAEIANIELILIGSNNAPSIRAINHPAVRILGTVDDIGQYYASCKILIAPTRFAAGIPYKVHEAAAYGIPVVCSKLIAEQLGWGDDAILAAACDDSGGFAAQCLKLYLDADLWQNTRAGALSRVTMECAESKVRETLFAILDDCKI